MDQVTGPISADLKPEAEVWRLMGLPVPARVFGVQFSGAGQQPGWEHRTNLMYL